MIAVNAASAYHLGGEGVRNAFVGRLPLASHPCFVEESQCGDGKFLAMAAVGKLNFTVFKFNIPNAM